MSSGMCGVYMLIVKLLGIKPVDERLIMCFLTAIQCVFKFIARYSNFVILLYMVVKFLWVFGI